MLYTAFRDRICTSFPLDVSFLGTGVGEIANKQSKYFLNALGHEGLNKMLDGFDDRSAEAVCTFGFCRGPGEEPILFQGRTEVCPYLGLNRQTLTA